MALRVTVDQHHPDDRSLVLAAEVVQAGGVIVYPTETLYGIGADALNPSAVAKVHVAKGREPGKPMLVLVPDIESLKPLVAELSPVAIALMNSCWPGPLTIVFPVSSRVPGEVLGGGKSVGIRVPSSKLCLRLLRLAGTPLVSTSANSPGAPPLRSVDAIQKIMGQGVDLFLDAGELPERKPSTVVDVTETPPRLLRAGAIETSRIRAVVPELKV
jgi:L-threonylcarbamoyladenylate synthase